MILVQFRHKITWLGWRKALLFSLKCAVAYLPTSGCETEGDYLIWKIISSPWRLFQPFSSAANWARRKEESSVFASVVEEGSWEIDLCHFEIADLEHSRRNYICFFVEDCLDVTLADGHRLRSLLSWNSTTFQTSRNQIQVKNTLMLNVLWHILKSCQCGMWATPSANVNVSSVVETLEIYWDSQNSK